MNAGEVRKRLTVGIKMIDSKMILTGELLGCEL